MKLLSLIFLMVVTMPSLFAQMDTLYLWPGEIPGAVKPKAAPVSRPIADGSSRVFEVTDPFLTVFEPEETHRNNKAILVCPGGGYVRLAAHKEGYRVAEWLTSLGYTAFVLQYRVPDQRQGALQDVLRAHKLIRHQAEKYDLDTTKIGAIGFSAGAHLVALSGLGDSDQTYSSVDEADRHSGRPDCMMIIYPGYLDMGPEKSLSPDLKVSKDAAPTFIFQSMDDRIVRSAFVLAEEMQKAGALVELHLVPVGGHGYGMTPGNKAAETWPKLLETWLSEYF